MFPVVLVVLTLAYLFILNTVGSMQQHKSHDLAMATVSVGLLTTSGLILLNLPLLFKVIGVWRGPIPIIEDTCCGGFFILPSWVVILCGLIGGIKGMLVLIQPGAARELFKSSRAK